MIRHGLLYVTGTIAPIAAQLLVTPLVTRALGEVQYGAVSMALVMAQTILVVCSLGVNSSITRQVILEKGGATAGMRLVTSGTLVVLIFTSVTSVVLLSCQGFGMGDPWLLFFSCFSGAGSALVQLSQALMRALQQPIRFILAGGILAFFPPVLGLVSVYARGPEARNYFAALALGQLLVGAITVSLTVHKCPRLATRSAFFRAVRIGLPTVPHIAANSLLVTLAVFVASAVGGDVMAGQVQIAALLGTAPNTLISAVNNAWAPSVYRTGRNERSSMLKRTTAQVSFLALVSTAGYAVIGPVLLPLIAGPVATVAVVELSLLLASSTALFVTYLANIHLTFVSGRTWPLAITSPLSTVVSIGILSLLAHQVSSLLIFSAAWFCYFLLQSVFSHFLARSSGQEPVSLTMSALPLALCFLVPVLAVPLHGLLIPRLVVSVVSVSVAALYLFLSLKK